MLVHAEVRFQSSLLSETEVLKAIQEFAEDNTVWAFDADKSAQYTKWTLCPSCCLIFDQNSELYSALHITTSKPGKFYVSNIVPRVKGELNTHEYNELACNFASGFRRYCRTNNLPITFSPVRTDIGLDDLISSKQCRKYFAAFASNHPLSYHPLDIERLDLFICSLVRYSRRPLDLDRFEFLLVEELKWPKENASWCRNRVEIGTEILAVNRRF